jgi:hypothetical protein
MAADAASHPHPRYIRDVLWSLKADGNDFGRGMTKCWPQALLPVFGEAVKAGDARFGREVPNAPVDVLFHKMNMFINTIVIII